MDCALQLVAFFFCASFCLQAGEFFHSTKSIAAVQQRELEAESLGEGSIDSPLLLEQVRTRAFSNFLSEMISSLIFLCSKVLTDWI